MSGDPSFKDPVIFYSEELTKTQLVQSIPDWGINNCILTYVPTVAL